MPSITREKAIKLQSQLGQGWKFDIQYYVFHGEYTIKQMVDISDGKKLEFQISFYEHCVNPEEKCGYLRKYEGYDIRVRKSEWTKSFGDSYCSHGLGICKTLVSNAGNKKAFKLLADISKKYTVEDIRALYTGEEKNQLGLCAGYSKLAV